MRKNLISRAWITFMRHALTFYMPLLVLAVSGFISQIFSASYAFFLKKAPLVFQIAWIMNYAIT